MPSKKPSKATPSKKNKKSKLIIVESPTKAKTIADFVGPEYEVTSSYGHLRDLPKSKLGIDVENNFEPHYIIPRKVQSRVTALKKSAAKATHVILATDEDREGEAIAWHLFEALSLRPKENETPKEVSRIVFHEITEQAIQGALQNPRSINLNLVDAQQGRRILDRIVGYKLSPFLWKKITGGLSAGRVQSVAVRLIVDREEEIKKFNAEEYHSITALLESAQYPDQAFEATLSAIDGENIPKLGIKKKEEADVIVKHLEGARWKVKSIEKKEVKKNPQAPFTTSTLQQTASQKLGFSAKKTMFLAQSLYENGLITYMRTDSVNLSEEALNGAKQWIEENLGKNYLLPEPRRFKTKSKLAQEAHEAIRPTKAHVEPEKITAEKDARRLYDLIWRRFIASQLPSATVHATRVEIEASGEKAPTYTLQTNGSILGFDGYLKIWPAKFEMKELPELSPEEKLSLREVASAQHFTEPPPRYNEASLVKTLEQYGIGRPSTYAPIISVIQNRNYVEKNQGRFYPTEVGTLVNKVLTENFPEIVDIQFTAKMENELDAVAEGNMPWKNVIKEFYDPFAKLLETKYQEVSKKEIIAEETDQVCEKCGKPMLIKFGRFGKFMACSGYPECKNTKTLKNPPKPIGVKCPECKEGDLLERRVNRKGRARGKIFWGCSRYPDCKYASWTNPLLPPEEKKEKEAPENKDE